MTSVVVVGAGVAGLTFAQALARAEVDVVVLESGGASDIDTRRDATVVRTAERGPEQYPRGHGVGGGSRINGRVAVPGRMDDWNEWSAGVGMKHWSWEAVAGRARAVHTTPIDPIGAWPGRFVAAATTSGYLSVGARLFAEVLRAGDGVDVHTDATVGEVLVEGRRAVGVRLVDGKEVLADHVVLAAGALESPRLAATSGLIGPGGVDGLKDHPAVTFVVRADDDPHRGVGAVVECGDKQIVTVHEPGRMLVIGAALRVGSGGVVRIGRDDVSFDFRMLSDPRDVELLGDCLGDMLRIVADLADLADVACGDDGTSPAELEAMDADARKSWLRRNVSGNWHAACSLPMGSVVDQRGRVIGADRLWCCDASVLPDLPRSPTQLPTMIVASVVADRFLLSLGASPDSD